MVSTNASTKLPAKLSPKLLSPNPTPSLQSVKLYDAVKSVINACDDNAVGLSMSEVNERLLSDVSTNLGSSLDLIRSELDMLLKIAIDVGNDATTVPTAAAKDVGSMSVTLKVDTISTIPSRVKMLLANFQNAVEDPKSLYPRLICCDVPVDPARIVNFARKHHLLDQLLQKEGFGQQGNRSMPSPPKSALDVITNVNSSLESVSDLLCEAVDSVTRTSERFGAMQVAAKNLASISEAIDEAMNQHEEIRGAFDRISTLLSHAEKDVSAESDDADENYDAIHVVSKVSSLLEKVAATRFDEDLVPQFQNAKGLLSDFVKNLTVLLSRAKEEISNLVSILRKFVSSLPRIAQELRQFFVPTGLQALILKPSPDLLSLMQSVDDLSTVLPEPATIESTSDVFGPEGLAEKVRRLMDKFSQLEVAQRKLFDSLPSQNLLAIINGTVRETLEAILRNLQSSAADLLDSVGDIIDTDDMIGKLRKLAALSVQESGNLGRKDQGPAGLVENVKGAGGLFGELFET